MTAIWGIFPPILTLSRVVMDIIQEPQGEIIFSGLSARKIHASELSAPVLPVCGTELALTDISSQKRFLKNPPGTDVAEKLCLMSTICIKRFFYFTLVLD